MAHKNKSNLSPYKNNNIENSQNSKNSQDAQKLNSTKPLIKEGAPQLGGFHKRAEVVYSAEEANNRLLDYFRNHDFGHITHEQRTKLAQFYVLLMNNQETQNFTRILKLRDIAIKHFIDCMIIPKLVSLQFPLMDMGTGPGFPGIPLKIIFPSEKIILAEGVQKRVNFLKKVREDLKLENLDIIGKNIKADFMYPVQGVITRAVEDVRNTLLNCINCLPVGGKVYLMKGPNVGPEVELAQREVGEYYKREKDIEYVLPQTPHQRRLLVYNKIKVGPDA